MITVGQTLREWQKKGMCGLIATFCLTDKGHGGCFFQRHSLLPPWVCQVLARRQGFNSTGRLQVFPGYTVIKHTISSLVIGLHSGACQDGESYVDRIIVVSESGERSNVTAATGLDSCERDLL